jgi:hypothetical protein
MFYLPLPTNVYVNFCHLHSKGISWKINENWILFGVYATQHGVCTFILYSETTAIHHVHETRRIQFSITLQDIPFEWRWQHSHRLLSAMEDKTLLRIVKKCLLIHILNIFSNFNWQCLILTENTDVFDRICCTCVPLYIRLWCPCRGRNM